MPGMMVPAIRPAKDTATIMPRPGGERRKVTDRIGGEAQRRIAPATSAARINQGPGDQPRRLVRSSRFVAGLVVNAARIVVRPGDEERGHAVRTTSAAVGSWLPGPALSSPAFPGCWQWYPGNQVDQAGASVCPA
jgi:hypothetical protein